MAVRIERQFDAAKINAILNHPDVRRDVDDNPDAVLDISAGVANRNNVLLLGEYGGLFFVKMARGVYEVHTQALRAGRGRWIAEVAKSAMDWMFTHTDAYEVVTRVPAKHHGARWLAVNTGLKREFVRPMEVRWRGELQDCDILGFRIQDWTNYCSFDFELSGRRFHDFLHEEAARLGVTDPAHPDDPNHNRYVGIALAMIEAGQVEKGVSFYNRWAVLSRHATIALESLMPVRIGIDLGTLVFENGTRRIERLKAAA